MEDQRAVSSVIGVILMVAITVILAAVIGVQIQDRADDFSDPNIKSPGVVFSETETRLEIRVPSMGNADYIFINGLNSSEVSKDEVIFIDSAGNYYFDKEKLSYEKISLIGCICVIKEIDSSPIEISGEEMKVGNITNSRKAKLLTTYENKTYK